MMMLLALLWVDVLLSPSAEFVMMLSARWLTPQKAAECTTESNSRDSCVSIFTRMCKLYFHNKSAAWETAEENWVVK